MGWHYQAKYLLCPLSSEFHSSYTILEIPEDGRVRGRENEKVEKSALAREVKKNMGLSTNVHVQ